MGAESKVIYSNKVRYLYALTGTLSEELKQEAIEALAAGGLAVIRQQIATALADTRTGLSTLTPGPGEVKQWLEGFVGSACVMVADELAKLLSGNEHLLNPYSESEFMDTLNEGLRVLAIVLTESVDNDFMDLLQGLYASLSKSAKQSHRVDRLVEWIWARGVGQMAVNPWLKEATLKSQPHRIVLKMLGIGKEQVEGRCRAEWNTVLSGLLDHTSRRLTSELAVLWTQHLYACHDRYLQDMGRVLSRLGRERLFA
ncbi:MAG TPA: hypothetical protein VMW83_11740 [Spirochaetia bacterium]|nr:hypothetical protein [Spirochaetia bacterium]